MKVLSKTLISCANAVMLGFLASLANDFGKIGKDVTDSHLGHLLEDPQVLLDSIS